MRRTLLTLVFALASLTVAAAPPTLTNLSHLDALTAPVTPPAQLGHATYRLREEPELLALWTYAEPLEDADSAYRPVGGGDYDATTDTWSQGAYNADDIARAAVVYLRHWQQTGEPSSRRSAYGLLRTLTYMQTLLDGPRAGNVVLWMQPDGTLNDSAEPVELPDPSDSGASYWLARTVWALGEGYEAFIQDDPAFAEFLEGRLQLALTALERQVLASYPETTTLHGFSTPTWLINSGADASSEAVFGLAAYVRASGDARATRALERFAEGILAMASNTRTEFPFGATLPWTDSRSLWHGWGAQMAGALTVAGDVLNNPDMVAAARHELTTFVPLLLTQGGTDQGWTPTPAETVQIAYGADALLQNLLLMADLTGEEVFEQLASVAGAWYFGNNRAASPMYDTGTGATFDGLETDGRINLNSGAESTIHGLLSMLALDAHPKVKVAAYGAVRTDLESWHIVEAEGGTVSGDAKVVAPESAWTGEANWSGGSYVALGPGSELSLELALPKRGRYALLTVFERQPVNTFALGLDLELGVQPFRTLWLGGAGDPGTSPVAGLLTVALAQPRERPVLGAGTTRLRATPVGEVPLHLDAVLLRPEVARLELGGAAPQILLQSFAAQRQTVEVTVAAPMTAYVYDETGKLTETAAVTPDQKLVPLRVGGFTYLAAP